MYGTPCEWGINKAIRYICKSHRDAPNPEFKREGKTLLCLRPKAENFCIEKRRKSHTDDDNICGASDEIEKNNSISLMHQIVFFAKHPSSFVIWVSCLWGEMNMGGLIKITLVTCRASEIFVILRCLSAVDSRDGFGSKYVWQP